MCTQRVPMGCRGMTQIGMNKGNQRVPAFGTTLYRMVFEPHRRSGFCDQARE